MLPPCVGLRMRWLPGVAEMLRIKKVLTESAGESPRVAWASDGRSNVKNDDRHPRRNQRGLLLCFELRVASGLGLRGDRT